MGCRLSEWRGGSWNVSFANYAWTEMWIKALDNERNLHMVEVDSGRVVEQIVFTNYRTVFADRFEGGAIVSSVDRGNWFRTRRGWGLMDNAGNTLIRPQFTHYNEINNNYALVYRNYNQTLWKH